MVTLLQKVGSLDELKDYKIPFGEKRQYTYRLSEEFFSPERFERVSKKLGQVNWGEFHVSPLDKFSMWGVLGDTSFFYHSGIAQEMLHLKRGHSNYYFIAPVHPPIELTAFVNGQPYILSDFRFYEFSVLHGAARTLPQALYNVYINSLRILNVETVREVAEHMKEKFTAEQKLTAVDMYFGTGFTRRGKDTGERGKPTQKTTSTTDDFFRDVVLPKHYQ